MVKKRYLILAAILVIGALAWANRHFIGLAILVANYERTLDRYAQTDTTETDVTATLHADGREASLVSAFFGLDNALPVRNSNLVVCDGAGGADGMPVMFSHEVDVDTLEPGDFKVVTESGAVGAVICLTLAPADDPGELRTVLLAGNYGSAENQPVSVEIVGNILSLDKSINFKGASVAAVRLEDGPTLVWAERVAEADWDLGAPATRIPWGGGDKCPVGTEQVLRVAWNGGVTKPGGESADAAEGALYRITLADTSVIAPTALADLGDGDNNHLLCLETAEPVVSVSFPAGHLTDPREDLNPATVISDIY